MKRLVAVRKLKMVLCAAKLKNITYSSKYILLAFRTTGWRP